MPLPYHRLFSSIYHRYLSFPLCTSQLQYFTFLLNLISPHVIQFWNPDVWATSPSNHADMASAVTGAAFNGNACTAHTPPLTSASFNAYALSGWRPFATYATIHRVNIATIVHCVCRQCCTLSQLAACDSSAFARYDDVTLVIMRDT